MNKMEMSDELLAQFGFINNDKDTSVETTFDGRGTLHIRKWQDDGNKFAGDYAVRNVLSNPFTKMDRVEMRDEYHNLRKKNRCSRIIFYSFMVMLFLLLFLTVYLIH